jgi:hypothetical protein
MYAEAVQWSCLLAAVIVMTTMGAPPADAKTRELPLSAFPELPSDVVVALQRRGCKIPQVRKRKRTNEIQGEFFQAGQTDWAVLCSTKKTTKLLVFKNGSVEHVSEITARPNGFSSWSISPVSAESGQTYHPGIHSWVEYGEAGGCLFCHSAEGEVLYYDRGEWLSAGQLS